MDERRHPKTDELIITASKIRDVIARRGNQNGLMVILGEQPNPFKGMCYVASALLYTLYDGSNMTLYKKKDYQGSFHWWIRTDDGVTIDITKEQYEIDGKETPSISYDGAVPSKLMWFPSYKKRIEILKQELADYMVF